MLIKILKRFSVGNKPATILLSRRDLIIAVFEKVILKPRPK